MGNVKKNLIYNVLYQILAIIIPLITIPFVSRMMGANGVGIYSYTYSIAYYFTLIGLLGISNYGNREIAKVRDNKEKLTKTFWSIYGIQFIVSSLVILVYVVYSLFNDSYKLITYLQLFFVMSVLFDINWFFFGLEKFKLTVTRNSIIKISSLILILIFIRKPGDVWKYTLILSLSTLISQIIMWRFLFKEVNFYIPKLKEIKPHVKGSLLLFIPVISYSIYKVMDKIMLGAMINVSEVAYYENAEKILSVPLGLIAALGTVMLPKISNLIACSRKQEAKKYIDKSMKFILFISLATCFGLMAVGKDLSILYLGKEFSQTGILINFLSCTIVFISLANVIRTQFLIPTSRDKEYIISTIVGAIINVVLNLIFIPKYQSSGACIGTIIAEFFVMFSQIIMVRKELPVGNYLKYFGEFLIKSLIMYGLVLLIGQFLDNVILKIIVQVCLGVFIYLIINIKYIMSVIDLKKIFRRWLKNVQK